MISFTADVASIDTNCTDGEVRLVNGDNVLEGRLEICINRAWGTVCSDGFSEDDAHVVCKGIGPFNGTHFLIELLLCIERPMNFGIANIYCV